VGGLAGRVLHALRAVSGGRPPRVAVRVGDPAELIPKEARTLGAEMIVLSWTPSLEAGHSQQVRSLFDASPCPLLLIPSAA